jgi:glycosyltransferase involved in cell wall biosynthesis
MKLIIQIPCYNEEKTLPAVISDLPRELPGIDVIEYLVIDDGSDDRTAEVARELGVHHILSLGSNRGLAAAFAKGIIKSLESEADIIVNTDGDNQYKAECIKDLIAPVVKGEKDIVIGTRPINDIEEFSWIKKKLQQLGSFAVRRFSGTDVPDTTSGFRAYSAEAAMKLVVFNRYTYTLETIIQAGHMNMRIGHVPIQVNPVTRKSRLISSVPKYVWRSVSIILRSYVTYKPLRTFFYASLVPTIAGLAICLRFLYYFFIERTSGHVQSLILAAILLLVGFHLFTLGIVADLSNANRKLINEILYLARKKDKT